MLHAHASMYTKHGPSLIEVCFEISIFLFFFIYFFLACSWVVYNRSISSQELIVVVINPL